MQVLKLDQQGHPIQWIKIKKAIEYYATDSVVWDLGGEFMTYRGGFNRLTLSQSRITTAPIIAIRGESHFNRLVAKTPALTNTTLFARDHWTCAYCGNIFDTDVLTRDHIIPTSRGGLDRWDNVITACSPCNNKKDSFLVDEMDLTLKFHPYIPSRIEKIIFKNSCTLPVQAEYLLNYVPNTSRSAQLLKKVINGNDFR